MDAGMGGGAFSSLSLSFSRSLWFFGTAEGLHAGQRSDDLSPFFNINHMLVPVAHFTTQKVSNKGGKMIDLSVQPFVGHTLGHSYPGFKRLPQAGSHL